jgi:outer membrane protease
MKRYALFFLVLFSFAGAEGINADDSARNAGLLSASVETFTGFLYGEMVEEVYKGDALMSRLVWDEHIAPYIGVSGTFGVWRFFANAEVLSAIPVESGIVTDTDWMGENSRQSHYSEHRSFFDKHVEISGRLGYSQPLGDFELALSGGILYRNRKWSAQDGFLQYEGIGEVWSENTAKKNVKGVIMTYETEMWFPVIGLEASYSINDRFEVGVSGDLYPYLHITTVDSHYLKLERYIDAMRGGMGGQVSAEMIYTPMRLKGLSFAVDIGWEGISSPKGSTSTGDIGESAVLILEKGYYSQIKSSLWWMNLSIILHLDLF